MGDLSEVYPIIGYIATYVSVGGSLLMGGLVINEVYQRIRYKPHSLKPSKLEKIAKEDKNDYQIE